MIKLSFTLKAYQKFLCRPLILYISIVKAQNIVLLHLQQKPATTSTEKSQFYFIFSTAAASQHTIFFLRWRQLLNREQSIAQFSELSLLIPPTVTVVHSSFRFNGRAAVAWSHIEFSLPTHPRLFSHSHSLVRSPATLLCMLCCFSTAFPCYCCCFSSLVRSFVRLPDDYFFILSFALAVELYDSERWSEMYGWLMGVDIFWGRGNF